MEILACSISAAVGACVASLFFVAGIKILRKEIEHVDTKVKYLYANVNKSLDSLEEKMKDSAIQQWMKSLKMEEQIELLRKDDILNRKCCATTTKREDVLAQPIGEPEMPTGHDEVSGCTGNLCS